jgi:hypothetical protein
MRLYKVVTTKATKDAKPDLDHLVNFMDLELETTSLVEIRKVLSKDGELSFSHRQLNSNDIFSLKENGRTLLYKFNEDNFLWIVNIDHKDYKRIKRDTQISLILN